MKKICSILLLLSTLSFSNDLINKYGIKPDISLSLTGIDKNDNGIRDDMETYFKKTYNQPNDKVYIIAISNISIIDNSLFEASEMMDILKIDELLLKRRKAELCMKEIFNSTVSSNTKSYNFALSKYKLVFLNTEKRKMKFEEIMNHYSDNMIFDSADKDTCASKLITIEDTY